VPPAFPIAVAAAAVWIILNRWWLPRDGVEILRKRWFRLPREKREFHRQAYALGWAVGGVVICTVWMFSMGAADSLAAWVSVSLAAFVANYAWFIMVS
jgi:hypothetical protein